MRVDRRLLGWGTFFILLGAIPLATRTGWLDEQLVGQWPLLWPVLLIAWGLGLLLRGTPLEVIGGGLSAITFGVMAGGALASGFGGISIASGCTSATPTAAFATRGADLGAAATADITFNCGTLTVTTAEGTAWSVSGSDGRGTGPTVEATPGALVLKSDSGDRNPGAHGRAEWNVILPRSPILALGLTLNAGEGNLDLSGAAISTLSMTLNAGAISIDLSEASRLGDVKATVNAGSTTISLPAGDRAVNLSLNAGNLTACMPAGTAIRVRWSGALGSNNLAATGLARIDDETWTSAGLNTTQPHVELHVSANAGSFELQFGGTCDA